MNIKDYNPEKRISEPGIYRMNINDYHSDCCDAPSFSSGDLVTISQSGEEYWYKSPYNPEGLKPEHKPHLNFGNAAHARILDPKSWQNDYILRPRAFRSWRGEEAKNWRMIQERDTGKTVITEEEVLAVDQMAARIQSHAEAQAVFSAGEPELSMFVRFEDIWIKCRPDMMPYYDLAFINDYKTTYDNSDYAVDRDIDKYGYAQKLANIAFCMHNLPDDFPNLPPIGDMAFALIFQKSTAPFGITCRDIDADHIMRMASKNIQAARTAAKCMRGQEEWQGYSTGFKKYEPKPWISNQLDSLIMAGALPKLDERMNIVGGDE